MLTLNRREFFSKFLAPFKIEKETKIQLPYSQSSPDISNLCMECSGRCVTVCEENIIRPNRTGIPYLDFTEGGCSYCEACLNICEKQVLSRENQWQIPASFKIDPTKCLAWQENICSLCTDCCDSNCIRTEGILNPQIDQEQCNSCGICVGRCPVSAIQVTPLKREVNKSAYIQRTGSGEA